MFIWIVSSLFLPFSVLAQTLTPLTSFTHTLITKFLVSDLTYDLVSDGKINSLDFTKSINIPTPSTQPTPTPSAASCPAGKSLQFYDDFNGTTLDRSKWDYCARASIDQNGNFLNWTCDEKNGLVYYLPENVVQQNGILRLIAKKEPYTYQYQNQAPVTKTHTSGAVNTGSHFLFNQGYLEAKIKVPHGKGFWPAFWSICHSDFPWVVCWPTGGELDVMEILGDTTNILHTTTHYATNGTHASSGKAITTSDLSTDFHTYAADWNSTNIIWYLDGQEVFRTANSIPLTSSLTKNGLNMHHVILNFDVGGSWPGDPDTTTPFPAETLVDYVKVCQ